MKTFRGALIGCGFFAQNHMHAWAAIDGAEIVALCDRDPDSLKNTAKAFDVDATYGDVAEMIAAERLDFVDIATTVTSHRPLVELAAAAELNIICQKPFAENLDDARAMVKSAQQANRILMVHENFRWQSAVRAAISAIQKEEIGTPFFGRVSFRSAYDVYANQPYLATDDRFIIQDLGIHILDISRAIFGNATSISALINRINPKIKGEDVATMLLNHENGATSVVDCSYSTKRQPETFPETLLEIDGDRGSLRLEAGYKLILHKDGTDQVFDVSPPLLPWAERPWHNIQESVQIIQQHFVECLRSGANPETSGDDNLNTLALVEAAYLSAQENRTVKLDEL